MIAGAAFDLDASVDNIDGRARARSVAYSPIFFGVATAFSNAKVDVDADSAKASVKNGLLTIRLPKLEKIKTRKIKIEN